MKKVVAMMLVVAACLSLCSCATEEDKALSEKVIYQIENINSTSLENAEELYQVYLAYSSLTEKQQRRVKNRKELFKELSILEELLIEREISKDLSKTITESELEGIWREDSSSSRKGYVYILNGSIYYVSSKSYPSHQDFFMESDYCLTWSYSLNGYSTTSRAMKGGFYCKPTKSDATFSVVKSSNGMLTMKLSCGAASGTYKKGGEAVSHYVYPCMQSECSNLSVAGSDSGYCETHSNTCKECNQYINKDSIICLSCILKNLEAIPE